MFLENTVNQKEQFGWIEVISGSMFSGKTEELIRRLKRAKFARQKVEIFKPTVDQRFDEDKVVSHDSNEIRSTSVPAAANIPILADKGLMRVILENLIGNAWKFTRPVDAPKIEVGIRQTESGQELFVKDNGVGFDMRFVDKLFQPFERLHSDQEFPGSGVGLATVYRAIRKQGGWIKANSALNKGTEFTFFV